MILSHPLHPKGGFHIDDNLYKNLIEVPKRIEKNKDVAGLVCGAPGNGKSTIAAQCAYIWNPDIINRDCFFSSVEDYKNYQLKLKIENRSRNEIIIHDEARESGSLNLMSKKIKEFWDLIYENRFLNMYQIFIQSDFFRTPHDIVFQRALFLIWVIEQEDWTNGVYLFYNKRDMQKLYLRGKLQKNYSATGYTFKGRFVSFWAGNPNYLKQKEDNFIKKYTEKETASRFKVKYLEVKKRIKDYKGLSVADKRYLLGESYSTYYKD